MTLWSWLPEMSWRYATLTLHKGLGLGFHFCYDGCFLLRLDLGPFELEATF